VTNVHGKRTQMSTAALGNDVGILARMREAAPLTPQSVTSLP